MVTESGFALALRAIRGRRHLSQLDLAHRVLTTQRHISFLERGRSVPGRGMVVRLGEALDLPLRERNDLLHAAGFAPVYPEGGVDAPELVPVMSALQHVLDAHRPYPAIVIDRCGTLISANDALTVLTRGCAAELCGTGANVYRLALHPNGLAPRIANARQWAAHVLQRLRQESLRNPDPRLDALLAELSGYVPAASAMPNGSTSSTAGLGFAVPLELATGGRLLRLITTVTTFATATDVTVAELKLEAFLPADADTAAHLVELSRDGS